MRQPTRNTDDHRTWTKALRAARADRDERGLALSVWFAVGIVFVLITLGIAVDCVGQVYHQQEVRSVAGQAARAGLQAIQPLGTGRPRADPRLAVMSAQRFLNATSYTGNVSVIGGDRLHISVRSSHPTIFLSVIGIRSLPVTASASARLSQAVRGP